MREAAFDPRENAGVGARFPLDVNRAPRAELLRVPGLGARGVERILAARRRRTLRLVDLARLCPALDRARPFLVTPDWRPEACAAGAARDAATPAAQLDLFAG